MPVWWSPRIWPGRGRCSGCRGSGWSARARCGLGVRAGGAGWGSGLGVRAGGAGWGSGRGRAGTPPREPFLRAPPGAQTLLPGPSSGNCTPEQGRAGQGGFPCWVHFPDSPHQTSRPTVPVHPGRGALLQPVPEDPLLGAAGGPGARPRPHRGRRLRPGPAPGETPPAEGPAQEQVTPASSPRRALWRGGHASPPHPPPLATTTTFIRAHGGHHSPTPVGVEEGQGEETLRPRRGLLDGLETPGGEAEPARVTEGRTLDVSRPTGEGSPPPSPCSCDGCEHLAAALSPCLRTPRSVETLNPGQQEPRTG